MDVKSQASGIPQAPPSRSTGRAVAAPPHVQSCHCRAVALPPALCRFVQLLSVLNQFICFCGLILFHPQSSVYFVCVSDGDCRPLVSVSHPGALRKPFSAHSPHPSVAVPPLRYPFSKGLLKRNKHFKAEAHSFNLRIITNLS